MPSYRKEVDFEMPLISVVIPTYNRSELVQRAIVSALRQSVEDIEVVVSDNLSSDETRDVVASFDDVRVKYVQPQRHMVLPDHWEFARQEATGELTMMLSDDDAIVPGALARFAEAHSSQGADFVFCSLAVYRDQSFGAGDANTLEVPTFTGRTQRVEPDAFIAPLMSFQPRFNMHPSGYMFASSLARGIAARNRGRFFETLGVEYFAWPLAAVTARALAYIDIPLVVIGRMAKSWGTNMVLLNPGESKINDFIADAHTDRVHSPFTNYTLANLSLEGMLTAKAHFPAELRSFDVDMHAAVRSMHKELGRRQAQGVDVAADVAELERYVADAPVEKARHRSPTWWVRSRARGRTARAIVAGRGRRHFRLEGRSEGFSDAAEAAESLAALVAPRRPVDVMTSAVSRTGR